MAITITITPPMKVLLPLPYVTLADFGYPVKALWFSCSQTFELLGFPIFRF
jgi:hypothetical protein